MTFFDLSMNRRFFRSICVADSWAKFIPRAISDSNPPAYASSRSQIVHPVPRMVTGSHTLGQQFKQRLFKHNIMSTLKYTDSNE